MDCCVFFGHRDTPEDILPLLEKEILYVIQSKGIRNFYVGNNGKFDYYVQKTLQKIHKTIPIEYAIVLSRIDEFALNKEQNATLFPIGLESSPPRFAISKRNNWLIAQACYAIVYAKYKASNSYRLMQKCIKKGAITINLAE